MGVIIREAERGDCQDIMRLKKELAVHSNMGHLPFMVSPQDLERDGFDTIPPLFHCLIAEEDGKAIGYGLYYIAYPVWEGAAIFLEDLCVSKICRGKGIGTLILKELAKICMERNYARITLECGNWNESGISFYTKHFGVDYTKKEEWKIWKLDKKALEKLVE